jgi:hypothetical protein
VCPPDNPATAVNAVVVTLDRIGGVMMLLFARLARLGRLRQLAHWLQQFESESATEDGGVYRSLLRCEKRPLGDQVT